MCKHLRLKFPSFIYSFLQDYCDCRDYPEYYTEECGWDGGDCIGLEDACEEDMESSTEGPPADSDEMATDPTSGAAFDYKLAVVTIFVVGITAAALTA